MMMKVNSCRGNLSLLFAMVLVLSILLSVAPVHAQNPDQYQVSFNVNPSGGGSTDPSGTAIYDAGSMISISATPVSGYVFSGWNVSNSSSIAIADPSSAATNATIDGYGTITANFNPTPAAKPAATHTDVACDPGSVEVGTSTTCTATVTGESSVAGLTVSWGSTGMGTFGSSECTLVGSPDASSDACSVTYTPSEVGAGSHSITANYLGDATHLSSTNSFSLTVTGGSTSTTTTTITKTTSEVLVVFEVNPDAAGSTTPSGNATYAPGASISILATANSGYAFSGWSVSNASAIAIADPSSASTTATVNDFGTITANFSPTTEKPAATQTHVTCDLGSVTAGSSTMCTATVSGGSSMFGQTVSWGSAGTGVFDSSDCTLSEGGTCSVSYMPTEVGDGSHTITANYAGDASHLNSTDSFTLTVTSGTVIVTTTTTSTAATSGLATVWTDQADYAPVDTPIIYGSGFLPNANITVSVARPEGTVNTWFTSSGDSGGFQTTYATDGLVQGTFTVTATDGTNTATTTFTDAAGTIVIIKSAVGGDAKFNFTTTGGQSLPPSFSITTSYGSGSYSVTTQAPRTYTVTESGPSLPWDFTSLTCTSGGSVSGRTATITLTGGSTVTCTFTDTKRGTIIINKSSVGGDATFNFTSTSPGGTANPLPSPFSITTSGGTGGSPFSNRQPGSYTLTESGPSLPWDFTSLSCTAGGSPAGQVASITLPAGGSVTCTFTDTKRQQTGSIVIVKVSVGGVAKFNFTTTGTGLSDFSITTASGSDNRTTFSNLAPDTSYSVTESGPSLPWDFTSITGTGCSVDGQKATITPSAGQTVTCTFTDTKRATLIVIKHVVADNGGEDTADDWAMSVTGTNVNPSPFPGAESPGTNVALDAGTYNVTESGPAGYAVSRSDDCEGSMLPGDVKTCTITNNDVAPTLRLVKTVVNDNGGTLAVSDFPLFIDGTAATNGTVYTLTANHEYTATETSHAGYTPSAWGGDCSADGKIALLPGDVKTCRITNDDIAPQLKIVKKTVGGDGAFSFTVKGPTSATKTITTSSGTGDTGFFAINAGTYNVTETVPLGWRLTTSSCSSGTPGSLTVSLGEKVTCTFTDQASFSVVTKLKNNQFRLIYTPFSPGPFKMAASNPGEFFDNVVFFTGSATGTVTLKISVPYPFVTQGSQPIHVFDGYTMTGTPGDFTSHGADITSKFIITGTSSKTPSNALAVTLRDYTPPVSLGTTEVYITLTGQAPTSGIVYVVIHLDYGFKGSNGWSGDPKTTGTSSATCNLGGTCATLPGWGPTKKVPTTGTYTFDFTVGALDKTQSVTSINVFKNDPGIAGLITDVNKTPILGAKVTISGPGVSAIVYTDEDGWYQYVYKYTGKAATFTITASSTTPSWKQTRTATLKSNGYIEVDFQRPA